jgi:hypothetical protein
MGIPLGRKSPRELSEAYSLSTGRTRAERPLARGPTPDPLSPRLAPLRSAITKLDLRPTKPRRELPPLLSGRWSESRRKAWRSPPWCPPDGLGLAPYSGSSRKALRGVPALFISWNPRLHGCPVDRTVTSTMTSTRADRSFFPCGSGSPPSASDKLAPGVPPTPGAICLILQHFNRDLSPPRVRPAGQPAR